MKTLREVLEGALVNNPDDLAAHMAYGDHLQELGDPRGELIQVQLALEDDSMPAAEQEQLRQREQALLDQHGREWLGPLAPFLLDQQGAPKWLRMRPAFRHTMKRGWISDLDLYESAPAIGKAMRSHPLLRLLRSLKVEQGGYDEDDWADLEQADCYRNITRLQLGPEEDQCHLNASRAVHLIRQIPALEDLRLYAHQVDVETLFALPLPHLKRLTVDHLASYPLEILANNASLANLTYLSCWPHALEPGAGGAYITLGGFTALARSPHLKQLKHLLLYNSDIGDEGCQVLAESGLLRQLEELDLLNGRISDEGARILAACPDLTHLKRLRLTGNQLTDAGIESLLATGIALEADHQFGASSIANLEYLWEGDME